MIEGARDGLGLMIGSAARLAGLGVSPFSIGTGARAADEFGAGIANRKRRLYMGCGQRRRLAGVRPAEHRIAVGIVLLALVVIEIGDHDPILASPSRFARHTKAVAAIEDRHVLNL
jgi:hypothetical protein